MAAEKSKEKLRLFLEKIKQESQPTEVKSVPQTNDNTNTNPKTK